MKLRHLLQMVRVFGPRWFTYRAGYMLQRRTGWLVHKKPPQAWGQLTLDRYLCDSRLSKCGHYHAYRLEQAPRFFFPPKAKRRYSDLLLAWDKPSRCAQKDADRLLAGEWPFFSGRWIRLGVPPDWHYNVLTGERLSPNRHWSKIPDDGNGDIKLVWELSRLGWVYTLVRAYWRTGDERYPEFFWSMLEDWRRANPPQLGANWKCGQEVAFRVMACVFGLYGFAESPSSSPERIASLAQIIAVSADRIESNLRYALSQKNNHGISEAVGLWTVALIFPEFHRSSVWRTLGRDILEKLAEELIYEDGSFVQHSMNYHRLMLHDYIWAVLLGDINGYSLSGKLRNKIDKAVSLLYQVQDRTSGGVPSYGHDDGALILPLSNCDYRDYRPVVQAGYYLIHRERLYEAGAWDEDLFWLFGAEALSAPIRSVPQQNLQATLGGYYTLRFKDSFAFVRCASYRDRPGQADMLHCDLWWRGQNIAIDPGTYSYNAPPPWDNPFAHTAFHNTVSVDGVDQMERVGRFIWLPWLRGTVQETQVSGSGQIMCWEGEHDGYSRLGSPTTHRRAMVGLLGHTWVVLDRLKAQRKHNYRLHWLFPHWPYHWDVSSHTLSLSTPQGSYYVHLLAPPGISQFSLALAEPDTPRGWYAPYYFSRAAALSLACSIFEQDAVLVTVFSPLTWRIRWMLYGKGLRLDQSHHEVELSVNSTNGAHCSLITSVRICGATEDALVVE